MTAPFELQWLGGASERHFRRTRPGIEDLPWGTLEPDRYPPLLVDRARFAWTETAFSEYSTALAFAEMLKALLLARAPLDLAGMASEFLGDEILHAELASRVAMELGGGAPLHARAERVLEQTTPGLDPLQSATEWVVRVCCVGEAFSLPMLTGSMIAAAHPLTRAVLTRILQDEAPHVRFGGLYLDWAADLLDESERARLGRLAGAMLLEFSPMWKRLRSEVKDGVTSEGFLLSHVHELGWMDSQSYAVQAREAVVARVVEPLARYGIVVPADDVERAMA